MTLPPGIASYGGGGRNLALVLPNGFGQSDPTQLAVARRLGMDGETTAVPLPYQSDIAARRELIWRLRDGHTGAMGIVVPSTDPHELARTLPEANLAWPVDGVIAPTGLDLSRFFGASKFTDFTQYSEADGPIVIGERWHNAQRQAESATLLEQEVHGLGEEAWECVNYYYDIVDRVSKHKFLTGPQVRRLFHSLGEYRNQWTRLMTLSHVLELNLPDDIFSQLSEVSENDNGQSFLPARMPILGANRREVRENNKELAVLGGFGVVKNASTTLILPPVPPPSPAITAASLLPKKVDIGNALIRSKVNGFLAGARAAVDMRIDPDPEIDPPASTRARQLRSADSSGDTAVLSGAGNIAELATLTAAWLADPIDPNARVVILGVDSHSRALAKSLIRNGIQDDRIWLSADSADPLTADREKARARRGGLRVASLGDHWPIGGTSRKRR